MLLLLFIASLIFFIGCNNYIPGENDGENPDPDPEPVVKQKWFATAGPYGGQVNAFQFDLLQRFGAVDQLYAIGRGGVFYTKDGGANWTSKNDNNKKLPQGEIQSIASCPISDTIFVGIKHVGVYRSTNGGTTWQSANKAGLDLSTKNFYAIATPQLNAFYVGITDDNMAGVNAQFYYCTYDGTKWTWLERNIPILLNKIPKPKAIYSIILRPGSELQLYMAADTDVYYNSNYGNDGDWGLASGANQGLFELLGDRHAKVRSLLLLHSANQLDDILYAGLENWTYNEVKKMVFRLNGQQWANISALAADSLGDVIIALQGTRANNIDRLYVAYLNRGILYTANTTPNVPPIEWVVMNDQKAKGIMPSTITFSMAVGFGQGANNNDLVYRGSLVHGMMKQDDALGFTKSNNRLLHIQPNALVMKSDNPDYVLAATHSGIFRKRQDINDTWELLEDSVKNNYAQFHSIIGKPDLLLIYAGASDGVYRSENDGGVTWAKDTQAAILPDINYPVLLANHSNFGKIWMANKLSVYYRTAANNWTAIQATTSSINGLCFAENQGANGRLYAATSAGLYYNDNPTNTLQAWGGPLNAGIENKAIHAVASNPDGTVLVVSILGSGLYYYNPARAAWQARVTGLFGDARNIRAIFLSEKECYIATDFGVWYSPDITLNNAWQNRSDTMVDRRLRCIVVYPTDPKLWYVGTEGYGIWKTKTAGE